jgi:hypothetical protein
LLTDEKSPGPGAISFVVEPPSPPSFANATAFAIASAGVAPEPDPDWVDVCTHEKYVWTLFVPQVGVAEAFAKTSNLKPCSARVVAAVAIPVFFMNDLRPSAEFHKLGSGRLC